MRRIVLSLSLVLLGSAPLAGQSGRPLALEDYYRANTVGSPRISPTGDWVTYTVSTRIEDTNETETGIVGRAGRRVGPADTRGARRWERGQPAMGARRPPARRPGRRHLAD